MIYPDHDQDESPIQPATAADESPEPSEDLTEDEALSTLAGALVGNDESDIAEDETDEAEDDEPEIAFDPESDPLNPGFDLVRAGQLEEAEAFFKDAIQQNPREWRAHLQLGQIYYSQQKFHQAIYTMTRAMETAPDTAEVLSMRALAFLEVGDAAQARADAEQGSTEESDDVSVWNRLAVVFARLGDDDQALGAYDDAIGIDPDEPATYYNRGLLHSGRNDLHDAVADFEKALSLAPHYAEARFGLALIQMNLGEPHEAAGNFAQVADQLDSQHPLAEAAIKYLTQLRTGTTGEPQANDAESEAAPAAQAQPAAAMETLDVEGLNLLIQAISKERTDDDVRRLYLALPLITVYTNPRGSLPEQPGPFKTDDDHQVEIPTVFYDDHHFALFYVDPEDERLRASYVGIQGHEVLRMCMGTEGLDGLMLQNKIGDNVCFHKDLFPALIKHFERHHTED